MSAAPSLLRSLAALLRTGLPVRAAIDALPDHCAESGRSHAEDARRRVALGQDPGTALASSTSLFGDDAGSVGAVVDLHVATGCDAASLLEAVAGRIEQRAVLGRSAATATAGAKLSGWIVAGLPLAAAPLVPALGSSAFDRRGSLLLVTGIALLLAGIAWIRRLIPTPPGPDSVGELGELLAAALEAGVELNDALRLCFATVAGPLRAELDTCARRVRLGATWGSALDDAGDEGLRALGEIVARSQSLGAAAAAPLRALSALHANALEAEFEASVRRAPVLMVLPLTTCILPAYVLLAIGPILRGLSLGS